MITAAIDIATKALGQYWAAMLSFEARFDLVC